MATFKIMFVVGLLVMVTISTYVLCGSMSEQGPQVPVPVAQSIPSPLDCPANHSRDGGVSVVEPILLISTLDGRLFAVGQKTGMIKWSLQFGSPIVNMYQVDESGVIQTKRVPLNSAFGASGKDLLSSLYLWQSDDHRKQTHKALTPMISDSRHTTFPLLEGPGHRGPLQSHCTRKRWFELIISGKKVEPEPLIPSLTQFHQENFLPSPVITVDPYALMRGEDENPEVANSFKKLILFFGTIILSAASIIFYKLEIGPFKKSKPVLPDHITLIGKIQFDNKLVIGRGSAGTCVYKGLFEGKNPIAVKRVITEHFTLADREIELLRKLQHPNLVRYFATESDRLFKYIAIELAEISLADYMERRGEFSDVLKLDEIEILQDSCQGLSHLHSVNVIHRDIKPQNILISSPEPTTGKRKVLISDFGVSKTIHSTSGDITASLDPFISTTRVMKGTDGWIAPEVLLSKMPVAGDNNSGCMKDDVKKSKQIDVFSMGCLFYYVFSRGRHPFGDSLERQSNIIKNIYDLSDLDDEENVGKLAIIKSMISNDPNDRPSIPTVLNYPLFWSKSKQLQFLQDVSDRIEKEDFAKSDILRKIERERWAVTGDDWTRRLPLPMQMEMNNHRSYNTKWLAHLIRMIRNKRHHYRDLPEEVQSILGPIPDAFMTYFTDQFPRLVYHVYIAIQEYKTEPMFHQYYDQDSRWDFSFQKLPVDPAKYMQSASPNARKSNKKKSHGRKKRASTTEDGLLVPPPHDFAPNFQSKENRSPLRRLQPAEIDEGSESDVSSGGNDDVTISLKPNGMVMSNFVSPSHKTNPSNLNAWNCTQAAGSPSHNKLK